MRAGSPMIERGGASRPVRRVWPPAYARRMPMQEGPHLDLLRAAIATEGRAHRALLGGDAEAAGAALREASGQYRESWEAAPPASYGRLVGMVKAAILAGDGDEAAEYVRAQIEDPGASPPAHYALAMAALVLGDDAAAARSAVAMRAGSPPFVRAADAITALATSDAAGYADAVAAIVADFENRDDHLTGVPIADTALMLERLAEPRGLAARPPSRLLPA